MQMYEGLPIITNQIPVSERRGVPHHLMDCISLGQDPWKITRFKREALKIMDDIRSRGKLPILVGGTHYYTLSILFHKTIIASDDELESSDDSSQPAEHAILDASSEEIHQKLKEVDPTMADHWHPNDRRKIRRSLQICLQTGRKASDIYKEQQDRKERLRTQLKAKSAADNDSERETSPEIGQIRFPTVAFWTHTDNEVLRTRLDNRVDGMIDNGLVQEAQTLFDYSKRRALEGAEIDRTRGIWISIGFKELDPYLTALSSQNLDPEELGKVKQDCVDWVKTATKQYAKNQLKWLRGQIWNSFRTADMTNRLYLLDATDPDAWDSSVQGPAEKVVEAFLSGKDCPQPNDLSDTADAILTARHEAATKKENEIIQRRTCELCEVTANTLEQWNHHLTSRSHKRGLRAAAKRAQFEEYKKRLEAKSTAESDVSG